MNTAHPIPSTCSSMQALDIVKPAVGGKTDTKTPPDAVMQHPGTQDIRREVDPTPIAGAGRDYAGLPAVEFQILIAADVQINNNFIHARLSCNTVIPIAHCNEPYRPAHARQQYTSRSPGHWHFSTPRACSANGRYAAGCAQASCRDVRPSVPDRAVLP